MAIKIAPSILAADFCRLAEQVAEVERAGVDRLHLDVMDGHFVPNISFGPPIIRCLRQATRLFLEAHLMIEHPERLIDAFAASGADGIIVHQENAANLHRTVQYIKSLGKRAGVAINPATPADTLEQILPDLDLVLVMTVNPGFGGQELIPHTLEKVSRMHALIQKHKPGCELEVDGGIDATTAVAAVRAGANVLVAGTAIFGDKQGIPHAIDRLRQAAR